ncbi:hypothetical protein CHS0354_024098 [Potamilus streckersoni]|uniref:DNA-directed RNA polymerase subunit n=1 Tax=Potamilus streckersoni TaxID=2493646 RepID=A0AAE0RZY3_9BIVA|nr:hypothetical protein CHS0354_024098 [Potamilus streckersoni]
MILARSHGEVLKPETINYRSYKPERDGLMCEKIFGPIRDWECYCGKYKRIRYKGITCDRCGVEVTTKSVRRDRVGHISLAVPVVHTWFFQSLPNKIGALLGLSTKELQKIVYYEVYVVIHPGEAGEKQGIKRLDRLTEEQYYQIISEYRENQFLDNDNPKKFIAEMGGHAIKMLLQTVDLEKTSIELKEILKSTDSEQKKVDCLKRLKVVEAFRKCAPSQRQKKKKFVPSDDPREVFGYGDNRPENMVLEVIPVIPPELRPVVPLEGGRFATSDLNDLYRRIIIRNNRLKKLIEVKAPEVILRNEKRMLQESVDALLDNSKRAVVVKSVGEGTRALKSIADSLKGKQGRFRQNLLGKRVDYSGRSVIVVGPELKLHECGLPKEMAIELFQPFVIRRLVERGVAKSAKGAKKMIDRKESVVWDVLEKVIDGHPVMLNRAPTLHRLSVQAFQPVLVEGKAIQIHPLVCTAFNADFDGDQMAVHVPLSQEAQLEAATLMLSAHNLILPQSGKPVTVPSQDMVLGTYYLTKEGSKRRGEDLIFSCIEDVIIAYNEDVIDLHARIILHYDGVRFEKFNKESFLNSIVDLNKREWLDKKLSEQKIIVTTVGRVLFNQVIPPEIGFINKVIDKKEAKSLINEVIFRCGNKDATKFLDLLKEMGFFYAMKGGLSIGLSDAIIPTKKEALIKNAQHENMKVMREYTSGTLTENEKYNKIVDVWQKVTNLVSQEAYQAIFKDRDGFNPLFMMLDSGARGSREQVRQLTGMRGLIARPQKSMSGQPGEIIENPIISNLKEGLTVLEYFISTHGARKGLSDTSLKTADAGYLTRRLHDVAQDVIINDIDCGTNRGILLNREIEERAGSTVRFHEKVMGRVVSKDVLESFTKKVFLKKGEIITLDVSNAIKENSKIEEIEIRSVMTCESRRGVCAMCYGTNLSSGRLVEVGEAVGVIASQSIGEPGTQLTLRTFHQGGTAQGSVAEAEIKSSFDGIVEFDNIKQIETKSVNEYGDEITRTLVIRKNGTINILDKDTRKILKQYEIPHGAKLSVKHGSEILKNAIIYSIEPNNMPIISEYGGTVHFVDIEKDVTYKEETDLQTGYFSRTIINWRNKLKSTDVKEPRIEIIDETGKIQTVHSVPIKASLVVENGAKIQPGTVLAKVPRDMARVGGDITAGLPRVTELFEAREPAEPAIVSEIDGIVKFGGQKRNNKVVRILGEYGLEREYLIPLGKHLLINDGDEIRAGDTLTGGAVSPQDILKIQGLNAVCNYLVSEIQKVYQINAGVEINDKHIEVIVRQMLQKVKLEDSGDTELLEGELVDRQVFAEHNDRIKNMVVVLETDHLPKNVKVGQLIYKSEILKYNQELLKEDKTPIKFRPAQFATATPMLLGITAAALQTESFISAASFQETTKVLTEAATAGKVDHLAGLKENVIVAGSVDDGKSTLIGRLLHDTQSIYKDQLDAVSKATKQTGTLDLSLLTDGLRSEREQGITIDVAYRYFQTLTRKYIIIDAPGHAQYTRNMATGASNCDVAVLLINAKNGILTQTLRHTYIINLFGIKHLIVCINKMDQMSYSQIKYAQIVEQFQKKALKLKLGNTYFIPISALTGENIVNPSSNMQWYKGPSLIDTLERINIMQNVDDDQTNACGMMSVQYILRSENNALRAYAGRVETGLFHSGEKIHLYPSNTTATISKIYVVDNFKLKEIDKTQTMQSVSIHLEEHLDISRGELFSSLECHKFSFAKELETMICWMDTQYGIEGGKFTLQVGSIRVKVIIKNILHKINIETYEVEESDIKMLYLNDIAKIILKSAVQFVSEDFRNGSVISRGILIDETTNNTVAACMFCR